MEAVRLVGYEVEECRARFLPYRTSSPLPRWPWVVRLYLVLPAAQWLFGKQFFLVARHPHDVPSQHVPGADGRSPWRGAIGAADIERALGEPNREQRMRQFSQGMAPMFSQRRLSVAAPLVLVLAAVGSAWRSSSPSSRRPARTSR